jgi:hypothetical protein
LEVEEEEAEEDEAEDDEHHLYFVYHLNHLSPLNQHLLSPVRLLDRHQPWL